MMRPVLFVLVLLVPVVAGAMKAEDLVSEGHVRIRVMTEPARQVMMGQQTRLFVEILTDTWFTKAPSYPELILDGAVALMPEQLGTNFTERIDGIPFAAQRRSYVIFPQRAGRLAIPSLQIRLAVSRDSAPGEPFVLRTRPLHLNVVLPPEAEGIEGLIATPHLLVHEEWSRPLDALVVGDAVKRTIRVEADRALGMLLPALVFDAPPGIAVYPDQPRVEDHINRGQYRGERVESVTYMLQQPGEFRLPAIEIHWWNTSSGTLATQTLAEQTFGVGGVAMATSVVARSDPWELWRQSLEPLLASVWEHRFMLAFATLGAMAGVLVLRRLLPSFISWYEARREYRRDCEGRLFRRLETSAKKGNADALVHDYWRWRDRIVAEFPRLSEDIVMHAAQRSGFAERWAEFERRRYGGSAPSLGGGGDLHRVLRAYRAALRSAGRKPAAPFGGSRLNPDRRPG